MISLDELLSKVCDLGNSDPSVSVVDYRWGKDQSEIKLRCGTIYYTNQGLTYEKNMDYNTDTISTDGQKRGRGSISGVKRGSYGRK